MLLWRDRQIVILVVVYQKWNKLIYAIIRTNFRTLLNRNGTQVTVEHIYVRGQLAVNTALWKSVTY